MTDTRDVDRFLWANDYESLCVVFVFGRTEAEVIAAFGGDPQWIRSYKPAEAARLVSTEHVYQPIVRAGRAGQSTFTVELLSAEGGRTEVLRRASVGTRAVSVTRSANAMVHFTYADDGDIVTGFQAGSPGQRSGSEPDRLVPEMERVGLLGDRGRSGGLLATCLLLAAEVLHVTLDAGEFRKPMLGAAVLPMLPAPLVPAGDRAPVELSADPTVLAAVATAADEHLRPAVTKLASRMLMMADLSEEHDLVDAVRRAGLDGTASVRDDDPLGLRIRALIAEGTGAEITSETSLRRSAGLSVEERQRRLRRRAAALAVRAALTLPPRFAMYALLHLRQRAPWPTLPELDLSDLPDLSPSEMERQAALHGDLHPGATTRSVKATASRPPGPRPQRN